jgi:predicted aspartyl protease/Flp pilus assembly protein TadD
MKFAVQPFSSRLFYLGIGVLALILMPGIALEAKAQNKSDDVSKPVIRSAKKSLRRGNAPEAETFLTQSVERFPGNNAIRLELAYVLYKQKKIRDSYDISLDVANADGSNGRAFAILGASLLAAGEFKEARSMLVNSLTLNRREALGWWGLGMLDFYENRIDSAVENLAIAEALDSNEPDFAFSLAQVSARAERFSLAADAYQRFLIIAPGNDRDRRDRIRGLISFLRFLGTQRTLYTIEGESARIPIEVIRDRPVIEVRVNGRRDPLRFVLDTGSGISVISTKTARMLGISPVARGGQARAIGGDGKFDIVYGHLRSVEIGDVTIRSVPVYIREFFASNEEIDGYIGLSLITKFVTTIDYPAKEFALVRKDAFIRDNMTSEGVPLPLRLTSSGFMSGEVMLAGHDRPLNFILDTGASVSVIDTEVAHLESVKGSVREDRVRVIGAAGAVEDVRSFNLPKVSFGPKEMEGVRAVELDLDLINEGSGFLQAGILGGNFLRNYKLTFNFRESRVYFSFPSSD